MSGKASDRKVTGRPAAFLADQGVYRADQCEVLRKAAERGELRLGSLCRRGYPGTPLPSRMVPELSSVGYWDAPAAQDWGLDWHRNEGIELTYLSRGRLAYGVDGRPYALESGDMTITRPWQQHRVGDPLVGASRLHWVILDVGVRRPHQPWRWPKWFVLAPSDLRQLTTLLRHNEQAVWRANVGVAAAFERLAIVAAKGRAEGLQTRLQLGLNELFVAVLELLQERRVALDSGLSSARRTVEIFLRTIPEHLGGPWTLESMAAQCGLGRTRFAHYCRQISNQAPLEYLAGARVTAAAAMLRQPGGKSITDIALECGFESSQYFATVFRRRMRMSPRDYRSVGLGGGLGGMKPAGVS